MKIQLKNNILRNEKEKLVEQKIKHQFVAEQAYQMKTNDIATINLATNSIEKTVISFDLQQCLPTPALES